MPRVAQRAKNACAATAIAGALAAGLPGAASADISCAYTEAGAPGPSGNVLAIGATTAELDVVAVQRSGEEIVVSDDVMAQQVACAGGTPTVTNIDTIDFSGAAATSLVIDLRGGQFAPGATGAPQVSEIEWNIDWTDGFLVVNSFPEGMEGISFGLTATGPAANLNPAVENPHDAEVTLGDLQGALVRGDRTPEFFSGSGGFEPFGGPADHTLTLEGGGGPDILHGGSAADLIDGGMGGDDIIGGLGRDDVRGGGGRDRIDVRDGIRDHVNCGSGDDKVRKDRKDELRGC